MKNYTQIAYVFTMSGLLAMPILTSAHEPQAAYQETLNVATSKEPAAVAKIRKYYTGISKQAANRKNITQHTDKNTQETVSFLKSNGNISFITVQSSKKSADKIYEEYLFDDDTSELIFAYSNNSWSDERGKQNSQLRCYWQNNQLIHSKIKGDLVRFCDDLSQKSQALYNSH
ncbi:MAG: hypothetical protein IKI22_04670 [Neisseriaceae bacterium]|nr:hypothetical protein [Neisseriaceae bacterium]